MEVCLSHSVVGLNQDCRARCLQLLVDLFSCQISRSEAGAQPRLCTRQGVVSYIFLKL